MERRNTIHKMTSRQMNAHDATIAMMKMSQSIDSPGASAAQSSNLASIVALSFWQAYGVLIDASSSSPRSHAPARQKRCASTLGASRQNAAHHTNRVTLAGGAPGDTETPSSCASKPSTGVSAISVAPADASRKRSTERPASSSAVPLVDVTVPLAAVSVVAFSNET